MTYNEDALVETFALQYQELLEPHISRVAELLNDAPDVLKRIIQKVHTQEGKDVDDLNVDDSIAHLILSEPTITVNYEKPSEGFVIGHLPRLSGLSPDIAEILINFINIHWSTNKEWMGGLLRGMERRIGSFQEPAHIIKMIIENPRLQQESHIPFSDGMKFDAGTVWGITSHPQVLKMLIDHYLQNLQKTKSSLFQRLFKKSPQSPLTEETVYRLIFTIIPPAEAHPINEELHLPPEAARGFYRPGIHDDLGHHDQGLYIQKSRINKLAGVIHFFDRLELETAQALIDHRHFNAILGNLSHFELSEELKTMLINAITAQQIQSIQSSLNTPDLISIDLSNTENVLRDALSQQITEQITTLFENARNAQEAMTHGE